MENKEIVSYLFDYQNLLVTSVFCSTVTGQQSVFCVSSKALLVFPTLSAVSSETKLFCSGYLVNYNLCCPQGMLCVLFVMVLQITIVDRQFRIITDERTAGGGLTYENTRTVFLAPAEVCATYNYCFLFSDRVLLFLLIYFVWALTPRFG